MPRRHGSVSRVPPPPTPTTPFQLPITPELGVPMIDILSDHEAFLRAIYDEPDDDPARLVSADFLEENGAPERAALTREQCDRSPRQPRPRSGPATQVVAVQ